MYFFNECNRLYFPLYYNCNYIFFLPSVGKMRPLLHHSSKPEVNVFFVLVCS